MSEIKKPTVGLYTLGCKVNQYESEAIAETFASRGFCVQSADEVCDVYVINTCTVTSESDRKARQFIRRAIHHNPDAFILVTGCLAQTSPESLSAIAGVDYICGNTDKLGIVKAAKDLMAGGKKLPQTDVCVPDISGAGFESMHISRFDRTRAYIKIEDGCESHCTYCIIPTARGAIRSKPVDDVLSEVRSLTENGCREVVLTGIETASYGKDLKNTSLAELLCAVDKIEGIGRVRLGSLDPSLLKQAFVEKIAPLHSLCPHFHISMQSGSDSVLARMKRKYNTQQALAGMERIRAVMPRVCFTTDMIVGFPGETEEEFQQTVAFARKARFLMIHVFPYSKRAGTPAAIMPNQVPEEIKHERVRILSKVAEEVRRELLETIFKQEPEQTVLFESFENGQAFGHTDTFVEIAVKSPCPLHAEKRNVYLQSSDNTCCYGVLSDTSHSSERSC